MALQLDIDARARKLIVLTPANKSAGVFDLPVLVQGDNLPIAVRVLDPDGSLFTPNYGLRAVGGYSLKVGFFLASNGTQLAFQVTFVDDALANVKTGILTCNSANQATALAATSEVDCNFEIEISEDGVNYQTLLPATPCKLRKENITAATVSVPPNETALSVQAGDGRYAFAVDCQGIIFYNRTTGQRTLFGLQDDGTIGPGPIPV